MAKNGGIMQLADYLASKGINPTKFAELVGVPASTITRVLNGDRMPRLDTIQKIVALTDGNVTVDDFMPVAPSEPERGPAEAAA
jgi:transcriptional regulator with XRE-family HTH domain